MSTSQESKSLQPDQAAIRFILFLGCAIGFVLVCFAIVYVPMNMDEAGIYHTLACFDHPFSRFNIFREACTQKNELTIAGGFILQRPQFYTGLFHSLLYAPFFYLFHSQFGQYLFGLVALLAFVTFTSRQTNHPKLFIALSLSFLPLVIQFVHDTGPVKFVLLLYPLSAFLAQKIITKDGHARTGYAIILASLLCLATEEKAFFLYLLPSLILYAISVAAPKSTFKAFKSQILESKSYLILSGVLCLTGMALLLFATNVGNTSYIKWLTGLVGQTMPVTAWFGEMINFILYWPAFAHNYFELDAWGPSALIIKLLTFLFLLYITHIGIQNKSKAFPNTIRLFFLLASFAGLVFVFTLIRNTWAGHHFIFLWVPLLVLGAELLGALKPNKSVMVFCLFASLNILSLLALTQHPFLGKVDPEKEAIFAYLNDTTRASESIYNFTTWGGYYIQALYGPKTQMTTYTEPYDSLPLASLTYENATKLLEISKQTNRQLYTICHGPALCSKEDLEQAFGNRIEFIEVLKGLTNWKLFKAVPAG